MTITPGAASAESEAIRRERAELDATTSRRRNELDVRANTLTEQCPHALTGRPNRDNVFRRCEVCGADVSDQPKGK